MMVDMEGEELSITMQSKLLGASRTSLCCAPVPPSEEDLLIKRLIDEIFTEHPFFGYRRIKAWLKRNHGMQINGKAILRHMREMGIKAIYPHKDASRPDKFHPAHPCLIRDGLEINRSNQVWSMASHTSRSARRGLPGRHHRLALKACAKLGH
jgi:putative transposase